jgi:hypothetical protein
VDKLLFRTRREAEETADDMRGWDTRIRRWLGTDEDGETLMGWVIECREPGAPRNSNPLYLREDGYIR